jgi:hypothetical protein
MINLSYHGFEIVPEGELFGQNLRLLDIIRSGLSRDHPSLEPDN